MTRETWLEAHAYLRPVAALAAEVERALGGVDLREATVPDWEAYSADYLAGVPLLASDDAAVDLEPGGRMAIELLERVTAGGLPERIAEQSRELLEDLRRRPAASRYVAEFLLAGEGVAPAHAGLLRYLGWTAMARFLRPLVGAFESWRDEERWRRRYCPTCGSPPAMAQLAGDEPARVRRLVCGGCRTRWQFRRTGCPFCEADTRRLAGVAVEGEPRLRIDHCEACGGYLKTCIGEGDEALLLADWSSLHLDVVAHDRGLKRLAASLYELDPARLS